MKLRKDIDLESFFRQIRSCEGKVIFRTSEDDYLNMKSQLCLFVFAANQAQEDGLAEDGELLCELSSDEKKLQEFAV